MMRENLQTANTNTLTADNFQMIFKKFYKLVFNIIYRIVNDKSTAEDLSQELFLDLWKKKENIEITSSLKSYISRSAINKTYNHLRKRKIENTGNEPLEIESNYYNYQGMEYLELKAFLYETIDELPDKCRTVFLMSRQQEMSYAEIAQELNISPKTVENHIAKALRILRQELALFKEMQRINLSESFINPINSYIILK